MPTLKYKNHKGPPQNTKTLGAHLKGAHLKTKTLGAHLKIQKP